MIGTEGMRVWIEVDLDRLIRNYRTACSLTESRVTCVLKANAYGHGAAETARALQEAGCGSFAVSCAREALELRECGIVGEILVMGAPEKRWLHRLIPLRVTLTAASVPELYEIGLAAAVTQMTVHVHLKLDTGFHRLGFECGEAQADAVARALPDLKRVSVDGVFSHLGLVSRERDEQQHARFEAMCALLEARGVPVKEKHLCDSIGLVRYPEWHYSRCRVGAFLFGVRPFRSEHLPFACHETLTFKTRVARVHEAEPGEVIGYDDSGETDRPVRVATLCAGYGDGYPRRLSGGRGSVLIRGRLAPVIGLVCMDQMMADVTGIPDCAPGDEATLLGGGISYAEYADWAGTNRNECLTILSRRPERVYLRDGRPVHVRDDLLDGTGIFRPE